MIEVSLVTGNRGRFEVTLDDQVIFSKAKSKRLPENGEIVKLAAPVLGPPIDWR